MFGTYCKEEEQIISFRNFNLNKFQLIKKNMVNIRLHIFGVDHFEKPFLCYPVEKALLLKHNQSNEMLKANLPLPVFKTISFFAGL